MQLVFFSFDFTMRLAEYLLSDDYSDSVPVEFKGLPPIDEYLDAFWAIAALQDDMYPFAIFSVVKMSRSNVVSERAFSQ